MRYWLFTRVYWNVPNRAYNASLRRTLLDLKERPGFQEEFRAVALHFDEYRLKRWLLKFAQKADDHSAVASLSLLAGYETRLYKQIYERNRRSCETDPWLQDGTHMDALVSGGTSYGTMRLYELALDEWMRTECAAKGISAPEAPLILIDVPFEPGSAKLGDDIFVSSEREGDQLRTLSAFSPVVQGVNENFTRDLQRLRIFLHPDLTPSDWSGLGSTLYGRLRKLLDS